MPSEAERILTKHHRFELLDALRGIGAFFVAALHTPPSMQKFLPFRDSFLAVDLFFCLSGFVIAFSYERRLQTGMQFKQFFLARIVRLYPLYVLGLILGVLEAVVSRHFNAVDRQPGLSFGPSITFGLFMLPSFLGNHLKNNAFPFDSPAWTLFFEMCINIFYAALVLRRLAKPVTLLIAILSALAIGLIYVVYFSGAYSQGWANDSTFLFGFPRVACSFLTGVLLFRLYRAKPGWRMSKRFNGAAGILVLGFTACVLASPFKFAVNHLYQFFLIAILMPALIFIGAGIQVAPRWKRICLWLGEFSYPLYILHSPLMSPLHIAARLHFNKIVYQSLAPITLVALIFITRWIAIHYDAPVRKYLTQKTAAPRKSPA